MAVIEGVNFANGDYTPDMPEGFWPEFLMVTGEYKDKTLAFAVTGTELRDYAVAGHDIMDLIRMRIDQLRFAMWQSTEWKLKGKPQ